MRLPTRERHGIAFVCLGGLLFLASNLLGHGIGMAPDPRSGLLVAAAGLLIMVLSQSRLGQCRERALQVTQLLFAVGAFSVVAAVAVNALQEFRLIPMQDWGYIPAPQLMFGTLYSLASLGGLLVVSVSARRRKALWQDVIAAAN